MPLIETSPRDSLHSASWYASILCIRCKHCGHRAALDEKAIGLGSWRSNMTPLHMLKLRCSKCKRQELEFRLPYSATDAAAFVASG